MSHYSMEKMHRSENLEINLSLQQIWLKIENKFFRFPLISDYQKEGLISIL